MDCKQANEILVDYLYEEIDREQAGSLEEHLHACPRCAEEVLSFRRTREMMGDLEQLEPSPAITQLLLSEASRRASTETTLAVRLRSLLRVFVMHPALAAAATLVAVLGVSFYAYRQGLPPAQTERRSDLPITGETATIRPTAETRAAERVPALLPTSQGQKKAPGEGSRGYLARDKGNEQQAPVAGVLNAPVNDGDREAYRSQVARAGGKSAAAAPATTRRLAYKEGKKEMAPPVQAPVPSGATYDDLKLGASEPSGQAAQTVPQKPAESEGDLRQQREDGTVSVARGRAKAKRAPAPSPRRRRARREANVYDVGGGASGVWANKRRTSTSAADEPEVTAQTVATSGKGSAGAKDKAVKRGLVIGAAAARSGRCLEALRAYDDVLTMRPDLVEQVARALGPCAGALKTNARYRAIAARATAMRDARAAAYSEARAKAKRSARRARPARKQASKKVKAAPAAVDAAK